MGLSLIGPAADGSLFVGKSAKEASETFVSFSRLKNSILKVATPKGRAQRQETVC
jgi:hypothetical protein